MELPLDPAHAGRTVMEYLGLLFPDRPRRAFDELFARGRVRSGKRPVGAKRLVGELPDLEVAGGLEDLPRIFVAEDEGEIPIIYEDGRLWALAKPSGVSVVPDRRGGGGSCLGFLIRRELASRAAKPVAAYERPRIVHRIDRLTSGLTIVARTPEAERSLGRTFEEGDVEKRYVALLAGEVEAAKVSVDCPIEAGRKARMRAGAGGKPALTEFDVLERFAPATLVEARPRTGRTHQIRVHAAALGHPVVSDPLYGAGRGATGENRAPLERLALHARRYTLPASSFGETVELTCPLPADFRFALDRLRAGAGR